MFLYVLDRFLSVMCLKLLFEGNLKAQQRFHMIHGLKLITSTMVTCDQYFVLPARPVWQDMTWRGKGKARQRSAQDTQLNKKVDKERNTTRNSARERRMKEHGQTRQAMVRQRR